MYVLQLQRQYVYEDHSINKLQNGIILLIFKKKYPKYKFCTLS